MDESLLIDSKNFLLLRVCFFSTTLSVFVTTIFLIIFLKKVEIKNSLAAKLILILSINDIFNWGQVWVYDLYILITEKSIKSIGEKGCEIMGFFNNLTCMSTITITSFICFMIYISTVWEIFIQLNFLIILIGIIIISIMLGLLPFIKEGYGEMNDLTCWIKNSEDAFYTYYLILYFSFALEFYFILHSLKSIYKKPFDEKFKRKTKIYLIFFPLSVVVAWFFGLLQNLFNNITGDNFYILDLLDFLFEPFVGIFNTLIYMMINKEVRDYVINKIYWCKQEINKEKSNDLNDELTHSIIDN